MRQKSDFPYDTIEKDGVPGTGKDGNKDKTAVKYAQEA